MKKVVLLLTLGVALVPSLWATNPVIKVQVTPVPTSPVSWFSYLVSLFH